MFVFHAVSPTPIIQISKLIYLSLKKKQQANTKKNYIVQIVHVYSLNCVCLFEIPWDPPGNNTGVGSHAFLQGIFLTQGSNPGLLNCRWVLHCLSHQGNP